MTLGNNRDRIDDIEVLRAIAVLFTMFDHVPFMLPAKSDLISAIFRHATFWSGVDLFFAISGFVIARSAFRSLQNAVGAREFWRETIAFWIRRVFRIWPLSWAWLILILLCSLMFAEIGTFSSPNIDLRSGLWAMLQVQNFHLWHCVSQRKYQGCFGDVGVWWSLSLEEQFYIVLPLALLLFKTRLRYALIVLVVSQLFLPRPPLSFLWAIRSDAIGMGVLLAMSTQTRIYQRAASFFNSHRLTAIGSVFVLLVLLAYVPDDAAKPSIAPFSTGLVAIVSIALVSIASFDQDHIVRNQLIKIPFMWLGSRSFAVYLVHFPAILLTQSFCRLEVPTGVGIGLNFIIRYVVAWLVITVLFAELSYRYIEKPMRERGREFAGTLRSYG